MALVYTFILVIIEEKARIKVTFKHWLNTHSFYYVGEFVCVRLIHNTIYEMFIVSFIVLIL
jgi:hypothetical protein